MRSIGFVLLVLGACVSEPVDENVELAEETSAIIGNLCSATCTTSTACSTICSDEFVNDSTCGSYGVCKRAYCGDGVCNNGETYCSCGSDCRSAGTTVCLTGFATTQYGRTDVNRCVPNVVDAFNTLPDHGQKMSFYRTASHPELTYSSKLYNHLQSVQRLSGALSQYLFVSRSYSWDGVPALAAIVQMGSRNTTGVAMRTNFTQAGTFYYGLSTLDRTVRTIWAETTPAGAYFNHAGGSQVVGKYVAIPLEHAATTINGTVLDPAASRISFYDLGTPTNPVRVNAIDLTPHLGGKVGVTGVVKLEDGRYLVLATDDSKVLFFVSSTTSIVGSTWQKVDTWYPSELATTWPAAYQNMQLVTQCDGAIFLVGTWKTGGWESAIIGGEDWLHVYRVANATTTTNDVRLTRVVAKHMYCDGWCNFDAGAGTYVDPSGQVILYATEHDDSAPFSATFSDGTAKSVTMREYAR